MPNYSAMYLAGLMQLLEAVHGFRWPANDPRRQGTVNGYRSDPAIRRMLQGLTDSLQPDGCYLPLGDTATWWSWTTRNSSGMGRACARNISSAYMRCVQPTEFPTPGRPSGNRPETLWGTYVLFHEFERPVELYGFRCHGRLGVLHQTPNGGIRRLLCGEREWAGAVTRHSDTVLTVRKRRPAGWPPHPEGVKIWARVGADGVYTGYPVRSTIDHDMTVDRFPIQPAARFSRPSVRFEQG